LAQAPETILERRHLLIRRPRESTHATGAHARIAGMSHSLLKFAWIAFREYWGVWVTGTGLMGLLLWMLNYLQAVAGWKLRPRHYFIVLFCIFWFLATFSAWHDADRNLQSVIAQRSDDTSRLGTCKADLKSRACNRSSFRGRRRWQHPTLPFSNQP
jgi:hypothetical protein